MYVFLEAYFQVFTEMAKSLPVFNKTPTSSNGYIPHEEEKISTPGTVEIGSLLTPVDHLPLITPGKPPTRRHLFHQSEDGDNSNDATDVLGYDSDGNEPPVTTLEDIFQTEPEAGLETSIDDSPHKDDCQVIIFDIKEIKNMKVDQLRVGLRSRGLYHRDLKTDLVERLNKACEDKVPLISEVTTFVQPSGFDK